MIFWLIICCFALAYIAIWIHHIFEGEWLPHDLLREYRLSRKNLIDLDEAWHHAEKSDIVLTLTTTPSRIQLLAHTLKSLLDQDKAPKQIILNIPEFSIREDTTYVIPQELTELRSVHIQRTEDLGPGTKLLPSLKTQPPDQALLVVDDDRIYPAWLITHYANAAAAQPDHALTLGGWIVPETLEDCATTIQSNLLMQPPAPSPSLKPTPRNRRYAWGF